MHLRPTLSEKHVKGAGPGMCTTPTPKHFDMTLPDYGSSQSVYGLTVLTHVLKLFHHRLLLLVCCGCQYVLCSYQGAQLA
jgi:hypothetical protein